MKHKKYLLFQIILILISGNCQPSLFASILNNSQREENININTQSNIQQKSNEYKEKTSISENNQINQSRFKQRMVTENNSNGNKKELSNLFQNSKEEKESKEEKSFEALLDLLKKNVNNPSLKKHLTAENIAKFITNTVEGNLFLKNVEISQDAEIKRLHVRENFTVEGTSRFNNLRGSSINLDGIKIGDNEIIVNKNTTVRFEDDSLQKFTITDLFEASFFVKYIVSICGSKLEKCDFNILKKLNQNKQNPKGNLKITNQNGNKNKFLGDDTELPKFRQSKK